MIPALEAKVNKPQMIDSPLIPEWMRQKRAQNDLAEAREEARNQKHIAATLLIQKERTIFWKNLLQNLDASVQALSVLKMTGVISPVGLDTMRIQVSRPGIFANFTHTDLFLDAGGVRCHMLEGGYYELGFAVVSDFDIGLVGQQSPRPMNPEEASEHILRRMVDLIESRQQM